MLSQKKLIIATIIGLMLLYGQLFAQPSPNVFQAYTSLGVNDADGSTKLLGTPSGGDLIQLIYAGPDGLIDPPAEITGLPTNDDVLMGTTHVGYGFPDPADWDQGKFSASFNNAELFVPGNKVYVRAFNDSVITQGVAWGDSPLYTIQNSESESNDFGEWSTLDGQITPVEMTLFEATPKEDRIVISWTTASETDNAGFHVFRSETKDGEKVQLTAKMINGAVNSQSQNSYQFEDANVEENKTYYYWIADVALDGTMTFHGPRSALLQTTPKEYALDQNYPNPFNPTTTINFALKDEGHVILNIYNIRGQLVRQLVDGQRAAGRYSVEWDGRNSQGLVMPSGTYLYSIKVNDYSYTRKMAFMK